MLWLALLLAMIVLMILVFSKKKIAKEIHLHELSKIWTKECSKSIHISELSPLWRNQQSVPGNVEFLELRSPRAVAFMKNILHKPLFEKFPQQKAVCERILKLLDKEGNCPSVVDVHGDVEGNWDENTYRLLAQTTLLDHSLNVAEQVVQILSDNRAWHVIPDTMVAALAHDLGKLQSLRGYLYSLGEHPLAAGRPLAGIAGFNELPKKDEILRAVRLHHKMVQGLLGKTLKKADQLARQKELEETVLQEDFKTEVNENIPPDMAQPETRNVTTAARRAQADIPYLVLLINTAMCIYISRYYVGNITRKAINSLLLGRAMSLLLKAFLIYVIYLLLYRLSTPENVWKLVIHFGSMAEKIYYGFMEIKPHLLPVAVKSSMLMVVAAICPYGSVYHLDLWHRYRIKRNAKIISA